MHYRDFVIPKDITVILDSQQVSHDEEHLGEDAWSFKSNPYLGIDGVLPRMTFCAGSRICPAVGISNRSTYSTLMHLILAFRMSGLKKGEVGRKPSVHPVDFSDVYGQVVSAVKSVSGLELMTSCRSRIPDSSIATLGRRTQTGWNKSSLNQHKRKVHLMKW